MKESLKIVLIILGVVAFYVGVMWLSIYNDQQKENEIKCHGGNVGIANKSHHRVTLHLFQHNGNKVMDFRHTIAPEERWVVCDSMHEYTVSNFPTKGWLDSAYIIFDDTLLLRDLNSESMWHSFKDHSIHDAMNWRYEPVLARRGGRYSPDLYRATRTYIITDEDYDRARGKVKSGR